MSLSGIVPLIEDLEQAFASCDCDGSGPCDVPGPADEGGIECDEWP